MGGQPESYVCGAAQGIVWDNQGSEIILGEDDESFGEGLGVLLMTKVERRNRSKLIYVR